MTDQRHPSGIIPPTRDRPAPEPGDGADQMNDFMRTGNRRTKANTRPMPMVEEREVPDVNKKMNDALRGQQA